MPYIIKLKVDKINPEPSAYDMREFGIRYNKEEWARLTQSKAFLSLFDKDLELSQKVADFILKKFNS